MEADSLEALLARCRVSKGEGFSLDDHPTHAKHVAGLDKRKAMPLLAEGVRTLSRWQELLYANGSWAVLIVIQAMDAAGKDGTIKHVMSGVNPQGIEVTAFKPPGPEALAHDFLWRVVQGLPARGTIGIFNRSHYEEVLVPRVHPEVLRREKVPPSLMERPDFWARRLDDIAAFERHLAHEGTLILKFFLHIGRDEQKKRFLSRLDEPDKSWKFDPGDIEERGLWARYAEAYEAAIARTAAEHAPWFIIPADQKWLMRLLVMQAINDGMAKLGLEPPKPTPEQQSRFDQARATLEAEK